MVARLKADQRTRALHVISLMFSAASRGQLFDLVLIADVNTNAMTDVDVNLVEQQRSR